MIREVERERRPDLSLRDPVDVPLGLQALDRGEGNLPAWSEANRAAAFRQFVAEWLSTGGWPITGPSASSL
jgi:hypothetical protein